MHSQFSYSNYILNVNLDPVQLKKSILKAEIIALGLKLTNLTVFILKHHKVILILIQTELVLVNVICSPSSWIKLISLNGDANICHVIVSVVIRCICFRD